VAVVRRRHANKRQGSAVKRGAEVERRSRESARSQGGGGHTATAPIRPCTIFSVLWNHFSSLSLSAIVRACAGGWSSALFPAAVLGVSFVPRKGTTRPKRPRPLDSAVSCLERADQQGCQAERRKPAFLERV
jgi:hypothetical protein